MIKNTSKTKKKTEVEEEVKNDVKKALKPYMIALFTGNKVFLEWKAYLGESWASYRLVDTVKGNEDPLVSGQGRGDVTSRICMNLDTFAQKIAAQGLTISTPILPPRTISYSTDKDGNKYIWSFHPACKRTIKWDGKVYKNLAIPSIVMSHRFKANFQYISSSMYMCKPKMIYEVEKDMVLYKFPFPNVYNDTHICWGGNNFMNSVYEECHKTGKWDNLMWTSQLYDTFFNSPFNNDLYQGSLGSVLIKNISKNKFTSNDFGTLIHTLQGVEEFPVSVFDIIDEDYSSMFIHGKLGVN